MPTDPYLPPAAIELAALATLIRAGLITDHDLRTAQLFRSVALFYAGVKQGHIQACRPIVYELAEAMESRKFVGSAVVRLNADNYIEAMVNERLTAQMIRAFIERHARAPS